MPKSTPKVNIEALEPLIHELTKVSPSTVKVKKMMLEQGLPFSVDPIQQLSTVLTVMNAASVKKIRDGGIEL